MKVLILTNEKYKTFIDDVVQPYQKNDDIIFVFYGEKISDWEELKYLTNYDIGISFMYQYKVPAKEVNTYTWFNFHPAPLPEYKGRNLCYHAIMNGEGRFGASVHYMDENFDTGSIIDIWKFDIDDSWTAEDLSTKTLDKSKLMFQHFFPRILRGEKFIRIPNTGGRYYPKTNIGDTLVCLDGDFMFNLNRFVRSITYKQFHPKLIIGNRRYKIVKDD